MNPFVNGEEVKGDIFLGGIMNIKVILEEGEDGYFVANCPSLKSCWSQGKTEEDALKNIKEAIGLYLEPDLNDFVEDENQKFIY